MKGTTRKRPIVTATTKALKLKGFCYEHPLRLLLELIELNLKLDLLTDPISPARNRGERSDRDHRSNCAGMVG